MNMIKYYSKLIALPLFFFILFLSSFVIWDILDLPADEELVKVVRLHFNTYGISVVFLSAIIEGILLVGNYFPGAFIIFLSIILAESVQQAVIFIAVIILALFIAHIFNYILGRYGWYRLLVRFGLKGSVEQSRRQLIKKGPIAIFLSYWLPNLGALTDTAAGIICMPFKKFFFCSLLSTVLWGVFFGILAFSLKDLVISFLVIDGNEKLTKIIILSVIAIWILLVIFIDFFKRKKAKISAK